MISIIITINSLEIEECISSLLMQNYLDIEIIFVVNDSKSPILSKIKSYEKNHDMIKIIINNVSKDDSVSKNIGLRYADGDYVLFLNSNQKLNNNNALEIFLKKCGKNNDFVISFIKNETNHKTQNITYNSLNTIKSNPKLLFKYLNHDYCIFYKKQFLNRNDIKFNNETYFKYEELFLLNCISCSNNFIFTEEILINNTSLIKNNNAFNINLFYSTINNFIKNNKIYSNYKIEFWKYIFGSLFNLIYELRDETTKRNYFKDSKLLFDEYCLNKGFYEDIHNSLDIMTLEFFNQTLEEIYYNPIKRTTSRRLINENFGPLTIAIKSPHPVDDHTWGDYFFAIALKKSLEKRGFNVIIHELQKWDSEEDNEDIVIVLRGLSKYIPKPEHINIMWNISHPEAVSIEEYNSYDVVFISSIKYSQEMDKKLDTVVKPLLQCTDPEVFFPKYNENYSEDILFVGKTRRVFREIIKDISTTSHDFSVYGEGWEQYIDKKFIKGEFIPNNILNQFYSSCNILLNDHWAEMRDLDFPSNRLFDALACGAFIISDDIPSANDLFKNNIVTYKDSKDLDEKIEFYLNHKSERDKKRKAGREIVLANHTFDNRADEIIETLKNITF